MATTKREATPILKNVSETVQRVRGDMESAVEILGKRATGLLPEESREQVDRMLEGLNSVRGDVNKTVESLRSDIEERFDLVRGTIDKRVTSIRKETDVQRKKLVSTLQKELRTTAQRLFKWLRLPVRGDVDALKRRLTSLERRLETLESSDKSKAAA
ncbi:MAG: hypothetical protein ACE5E4_01065 [Candidatus Binatia bacterium]